MVLCFVRDSKDTILASCQRRIANQVIKCDTHAVNMCVCVMDAFIPQFEKQSPTRRVIDALLMRGRFVGSASDQNISTLAARPSVGTFIQSTFGWVHARVSIVREKQTPKVSRASINLGAWQPQPNETNSEKKKHEQPNHDRGEHFRVWWTTAPFPKWSANTHVRIQTDAWEINGSSQLVHIYLLGQIIYTCVFWSFCSKILDGVSLWCCNGVI